MDYLALFLIYEGSKADRSEARTNVISTPPPAPASRLPPSLLPSPLASALYIGSLILESIRAKP